MTTIASTITRKVLLLGPQGRHNNVVEAISKLAVDGPIATITAGWEERDGEDSELSEAFGGRIRNLGLYARTESLFRADGEVRQVLYERYDRLRELQGVYRLRLAGQLQACRTLLEAQKQDALDALYVPEIDDALRAITELDAHHLHRVSALDAEIAERLDVANRSSLQQPMEELRTILSSCEALLIAGGHVAILLNRLRLFSVLDLAPALPIVAWSGGAMVLGERIVLFHDSPPQGSGDAEILSAWMGLIQGLLPLPHASERLRLTDPARVALFARRFARETCVCMDGGELIEGSSDQSAWNVPTGVRILGQSGEVEGNRPA